MYRPLLSAIVMKMNFKRVAFWVINSKRFFPIFTVRRLGKAHPGTATKASRLIRWNPAGSLSITICTRAAWQLYRWTVRMQGVTSSTSSWTTDPLPWYRKKREKYDPAMRVLSPKSSSIQSTLPSSMPSGMYSPLPPYAENFGVHHQQPRLSQLQTLEAKVKKRRPSRFILSWFFPVTGAESVSKNSPRPSLAARVERSSFGTKFKTFTWNWTPGVFFCCLHKRRLYPGGSFFFHFFFRY